MKEELGLVHIYCGEGKGKTTAAMGLALRAIGHGLRVVIVQFLKDGQSGELMALEQFPQITIFAGKSTRAFSFHMTDEERAACKLEHDANLMNAIRLCESGSCDILILDEAVGAYQKKLLAQDLLLNFIENRPPNIEILLTGRNPDEKLCSLADYISEIKKIKHPFDRGIRARFGIEK